MTQEQRIMAYLNQHGSITQAEAVRLGIYRLSARVYDLSRAGVFLDRMRETSKNQYGEDVTYTRYYLRKEGEHGGAQDVRKNNN